MGVYSYKCPNCGASLKYSPTEAKLNCEYCGSSFTQAEIDERVKSNPDLIDESVDNEHETQENGRIKGYNCNSCGAEVVTDDTTLTTFCYYCHSPVVLTDRAKGDFQPDKVIPFKFDKEEATNRFLSWVSKKRYVPKSFYSTSQLEKITGMYLPYWEVDANYRMNVSGTGYTKKVRRVGDTEYTDTSSYKVVRNGEFGVSNVIELAYKKIEKPLIDSISPYDIDNAEPFKVFYLNGFFSETYELTKDDITPVMNDRLKKYKEEVVKSFFDGYNSYEIDYENSDEIDRKWNYVLLPTWIMTYDFNDKKYVYAMNGQTGKAFGDLPIDDRLILKDAAIFGVIIFLIALVGGYFIW